MKKGSQRIVFASIGTLVMLSGLTAARLFGQADSFERDRMKSILQNVSQEIEKNFYDPQMHGLEWKALTAQARERIEKAKSAGEMLTAIFVLVDKLKDSHTFFIPPPRAVKALFGFEAKPFGDEIRIYELKKDGAAAAAGLQLGDRLLSINGYPVERRSFDLLILYLRLLRPVAVMDIVYSRGNEPPQQMRVQGKMKEEPIMKDLTTLESIYNLLAEMKEEEYARTASFEGDIGYVNLRTFAVESDLAEGAFDALKKSRAYIIDLRGNTGGSVGTLAAVAGHFEEQPTVMADQVGRKKTEPIKLKPRRPTLGGPMFILIDSRSMSASEMFARHFQRTGRAKVIGDSSLGRVNAAHIIPLQLGTYSLVVYGVEVSVARVVLPGGEELENRGVTPDQVCIPTGEDLREKRDPCRDLAVSLARKALGLPEEPAKEQKPEEKKGEK